MTYWIGKRKSNSDARPVPTSKDSKSSSTVRPVYHGILVEGSTTLSPRSAEIGTTWVSSMPKRLATEVNSASISRKTDSEKSTKSILLTPKITWRTPSKAATFKWRRVCSTTPWRASISTTTTWEVEDRKSTRLNSSHV